MTVPTAAPLSHPFTPGSVRAAFSYRDFRLVWIGLLASNIGTWMQNVALPAYVQRRTGSAAIVGLMVFAQLGPLLLLSIPGGILANRFPRRPWLITMQSTQIVFSLALAALVARDAPIAALFGINLLIGIANALNAPAFQSSIPLLLDRRDLAGAIALNSVSLNGSRVIGPVIAALLGVWGVTVSQLFVINAVTYLFVIAALAVVHIPVVVDRYGDQGWRQLTVGVRIARSRPILARILLSMALFSFFSLPYVGLFPAVAELNFGIDAGSPAYKWLYATWGLGACLGALGTGTLFAGVDKRRLLTPRIPRVRRQPRRLRPRPGAGAGVPDRLRPRLLLLPHGDGAAHRAAAEHRGPRTGGRDVAVVHGVRRNRPARQPCLRPPHGPHRRTLDHARRCGVRGLPRLVVQPRRAPVAALRRAAAPQAARDRRPCCP